MSLIRSHALAALAAAIAMLSGANAQTLPANQIPAPVQKALQTRFPGVKKAEWKLKSDKNYEAEFVWQGAEIAAKFDARGKWLETETAIPRAKVPQSVNAAIAKAFPRYKVIETQTLAAWNASDALYEIHVENARDVVKAQFAPDGRLLNQSAKAKPVK